MKRHIARSQLFKRFLLSYTLILIVPTLLLFFFLAETTAIAMKESLMETEIRQADLLKTNLVTEFKGYSEIARNLSVFQEVEPFLLQSTPGKGGDLIRDIRKNFTNHNIVDDIFVYFFCDQYFYSSTTSYSSRSFTEHFGMSTGQARQFIADIGTIDAPFFLRNILPQLPASDQARDSYVLYTVPLKKNEHSFGAVSFAINEKRLNKWLDTADNTRFTYLFDNGSNLINRNKLDDGILKEIPYQKISNLIERALQNEGGSEEYGNFSILYGKVPGHEIIYVRFIKNLSLYKKLYTIQRVYFVLLIAILLLGFTIISYLMRFTYRPIRQLRSIIGQQGSVSNNEIEEFTDAFSNLKNDNQSIREKLEQSAKQTRRYLLESMLCGTILNRDAFAEQCEEVGLATDAFCYTVAAVKSDGVSDPAEYLCREFFFVKRVCSAWQVYSAPNNNIWIIGLEKALTFAQIQKVNASRQLLLGACQKNWYDISNSYTEVCSSDKAAEVSKMHLQSTQRFMDNYAAMIAEAARLLEQNGKEILQPLTDKFYFSLESEDMPLNFKKQQCMKFIMMLEGWRSSTGLPDEAFTFAADKIPNVATSQQLHDILNECVKRGRLMQIEKHPPINIEEILLFTQQNFSNPEFSLQVIADYFSVSVSYVSQFFKDNYSSNLLTYYTGLRMERARLLLDTTDFTLADIVLQVGYLNQSSFIRRFKQIYGITPGEYKRKQISP